MPQPLLLLVAHGSRDPRWRQPFELLLQWALGEEPFAQKPLALAYMEMAEPTVLQAVETALSQEPDLAEVRLLPLLMAAGAHFANEIQEEAQALRQRWPNLQVVVEPPVGEHPQMQAALKALISGFRSLPVTPSQKEGQPE